MQYIRSILVIPWTLKIGYGLIADNIPLFGSRRKNYIVLNGLLIFCSMFLLSLNLSSSPSYLTLLLFLNSLACAFVDVVVDALMVIQCRLDPENGSNELQFLTWGMLSVGGIVGSLLSAFFTAYMDPRVAFFVCAFLGLVIAAIGVKMPMEVDGEGEEEEGEKSGGVLEDAKRNFREIKEAICIPEIYRTLIFLLLSGLLSPSFSSYEYYF